MSLGQFLQILWARKWIILSILFVVTTVAVVVGNLLPKRYPATARVLFEVTNRDQFTGLGVSGRELSSYVNTQVELLKDMRVVGQVVDQLGLAERPEIVRAYARTGRSDIDGGIRRWVGQNIARDISVRFPGNSTIMEIVYVSDNPQDGRRIVEAIRNAYLDVALRTRTDMAARNRQFYLEQAEKARRELDEAEARSSAFMRENGIILTGGIDSETATLNALQAALQQARGQAGQSDVVAAGRLANDPVVDQIKMQIVAIDDALVQASEKLGPEHPTYKAIQARRALLQKQLAAAQAANRAAVSQVTGNVGQATIRQLEQQVAAQARKVLDRRPIVDEALRLEREVEMRRQQYDDAVKAAAQLRTMADVPAVGISALGDAVGSTTPTYPNLVQITALSIVAGLGLGILVAILAEFLARRVRGPEDLAYASGSRVLAVIGAPPPGRAQAWLQRLLRGRAAGRAPGTGGTLPQAA